MMYILSIYILDLFLFHFILQHLFVVFRSCDLDEWTAEQLQIMKVSGNGTTRDYFKKHGVTETQMAVSKDL